VRITKKLPSRITVEGLDRGPYRAFLRALGLKDADLAKPFVGVVSTRGLEAAAVIGNTPECAPPGSPSPSLRSRTRALAACARGS
jgi:hypothetical protein